jgi:hypothetical protein
MSDSDGLHIYHVGYNLCSDEGMALGCRDIRTYVRARTPLVPDSLEEIFGKRNFKFTLNFLEEIDREEAVRRLGSGLEIVPLVN